MEAADEDHESIRTTMRIELAIGEVGVMLNNQVILKFCYVFRCCCCCCGFFQNLKLNELKIMSGRELRQRRAIKPVK